MANPYAVDARWDDAVSREDVIEERACFIVKTYQHLVGAILAFTLLEVLYFTTPVAAWLMTNVFMGVSWLIVLGGFLIVSWLASHVAHPAKSLPAQYLALLGYTLLWSVLFVPLIAYAEMVAPGALESAGIVSILGFAALTMIAFKSRKDFSFLGPFIMYGMVVAMITIALAFFMGFQLGVWFSGGMILIAGGAILYDTSNVIRRYPPGRHVAASLELFGSFALLLWYVLRLFIQLQND